MIRGSVVDMPVVESAIRKATRTIRGVMQASMVLRVREGTTIVISYH